jgi:branched-chain amino acid transport system permease protein
LVTLAFAEVFRILANTFGFTGAGVGLQLPLSQEASQMQFSSKVGYLYLILALFALAFGLAQWLKGARLGAWLAAVRDNEEAAQALGVNAFAVKLIASVLSGALMGLGGAFYVQYLHYIDPGIAYGPNTSVEALLAAIVGGMGTVWGPLLGALLLQLLGEATRGLFENAQGLSLVLYGVLLVVMVTFAPKGLAGLWDTLAARRRSRNAQASAAEAKSHA